MERRWRNIMISVATSIGFTGIFISFGLGNAIVDIINKETDNGNIPAQVQISLNSQATGGGVLNQSDIDYLNKLIGKENIKYLESPFSTIMQSVSLDGKTMDLSSTLPNYAQIVSLYKDSTIMVSSNTKKNIIAGKPYKDPDEEGLTVPITFIENFNKLNKTNYSAKNIIGKKVDLVILENTEQGNHTAEISMKITRVLTDELEDSNSYVAPNTLDKILKNNSFTKVRPYFILELKEAGNTESVVDKIKKNKKYTVFSQQEILNLVINFIRVIQGLLIVLSSQAVLVSMVMIGIIIYINIMQRSKEIGVMKAVGYLNKDVKSIFIYESLLITFISLLVAYVFSQVIGMIANIAVKHFYPNITRVFFLNWQSILIMFALAMAMGYISAYFPTKKISKLDPVESLRYE